MSFDNLLNIAVRFFSKSQLMISSYFGWVSIAILSIFSYFEGGIVIYNTMIGIVLVDAILGVLVAKKNGDYATSYLLRETCWKIMFYSMWLMIVFSIEKALGSNTGFGLMGSFAIAATVEAISIFANGLILKPDFVYFRIMIKPLRGEIATKLGICIEDVDAVFESKSKLKEVVLANKEANAKNKKKCKKTSN